MAYKKRRKSKVKNPLSKRDFLKLSPAGKKAVARLKKRATRKRR